jgi:hypothetical protein
LPHDRAHRVVDSGGRPVRERIAGLGEGEHWRDQEVAVPNAFAISSTS